MTNGILHNPDPEVKPAMSPLLTAECGICGEIASCGFDATAREWFYEKHGGAIDCRGSYAPLPRKTRMTRQEGGERG